MGRAFHIAELGEAACVILIGMNSACHKSNDHNNNNNDLQDFQQVNLVANQTLYGAKLTDTTLKNAWGLAFSSSGTAWVNSQAGHGRALSYQTGRGPGANFIYAANFKTAKIDVWDTTFASVSMPFRDPGLPAGYAGFLHSNDMNDYSKKAGTANNPGNGYSQGSGDTSSQPAILVGNFGDGRINVFTLSGQYLGQLQSANKTIVIDGLWTLSFPPSTAPTIDPKRLYFSAGPDDEKDGLFGYLSK